MVERCWVTVVVGLALVVENGSVGGYSWHIGAARRPLTFPCLSLSLSFSSSLFRLLCIVLSATRHLSPSHLSVPPFSLTRPGSLFLVHGTPFISSFPPRPPAPCEPAHRRTGIVCAHRSRPLSVETPSTLCLLVWFRPRPPPFPPRILRRRYLSPITPLDASSSSPSPPAATPSPSPDGDVAVCYDLHSSRNKTSATVLRPPTTINEKPCTKCITTSHVPAAKGHALTSHFFPYLLLHFFFFCLFPPFLPSRPINRPANLPPSFGSSFFPTIPYLAFASLPASRDYPCYTPVDTCHSPNLCHFKHEFICTAYLRVESVKYHRYAALDRR